MCVIIFFVIIDTHIMQSLCNQDQKQCRLVSFTMLCIFLLAALTVLQHHDKLFNSWMGVVRQMNDAYEWVTGYILYHMYG